MERPKYGRLLTFSLGMTVAFSADLAIDAFTRNMDIDAPGRVIVFSATNNQEILDGISKASKICDISDMVLKEQRGAQPRRVNLLCSNYVDRR